ncbi:MAG: RimK family alpha-L-glutamate ligase [Deltaproteobacteria bacterium]|nr:RimK family alpha-L-glutamate ligase [Deltaproteobacteria bacterium]MCB9785758.1 RimK family alpha-L-glutamate ligase [Deltaproteobacteria bacterium]
MSAERLAILSHSESFYSTRRLLEAARAVGLAASLIDPVRVTLSASGGPGPLFQDGAPLAAPELLVPRIGARLTGWGLALVQGLVDAGSFSAAQAQAIGRAQDKLATTQRLAAAGLPVVPTVAVREPAHADRALEALGGAPVVVKLREGSQGRQVLLARNDGEARRLIGSLTARGQAVLVQPLVEAARGRDLRVLVIGGEPQAAVWRVAAAGEFRSNLHLGGRAEAAELNAEAGELARRAARAMDLPLCGVDLLPSGDRLRVLEVNASPGLEGVEAATGRDLAREVVLWLRAALRAHRAGQASDHALWSRSSGGSA